MLTFAWERWSKKQREKLCNSHYEDVSTYHKLHITSLGLTFAGLNALKPPVINISVDNTRAVLIPSTARSATTGYAGFLEVAAF